MSAPARWRVEWRNGRSCYWEILDGVDRSGVGSRGWRLLETHTTRDAAERSAAETRDAGHEARVVEVGA